MGVTRSLFFNICAMFTIFYLTRFCCSHCTKSMSRGYLLSIVYSTLVVKNSFFLIISLVVIVSSLLIFLDSNILIVSVNILSNPDMLFMLGPNSSSISHQCITLWDSFWFSAYTKFLWSKYTFIFYPKIFPMNCLRHYTIKRTSFSVAV